MDRFASGSAIDDLVGEVGCRADNASEDTERYAENGGESSSADDLSVASGGGPRDGASACSNGGSDENGAATMRDGDAPNFCLGAGLGLLRMTATDRLSVRARKAAPERTLAGGDVHMGAWGARLDAAHPVGAGADVAVFGGELTSVDCAESLNGCDQSTATSAANDQSEFIWNLSFRRNAPKTE